MPENTDPSETARTTKDFSLKYNNCTLINGKFLDCLIIIYCATLPLVWFMVLFDKKVNFSGKFFQ